MRKYGNQKEWNDCFRSFVYIWRNGFFDFIWSERCKMLSIWEKGEGIRPKIKRKKPDNGNGRKRSRDSSNESETVQMEESRPRGNKEMNVEKRWEAMIEGFIKNGNYPFWFGL